MAVRHRGVARSETQFIIFSAVAARPNNSEYTPRFNKILTNDTHLIRMT